MDHSLSANLKTHTHTIHEGLKNYKCKLYGFGPEATKIVYKSWFIYPIWTIGTYKVVLVDQESTVKTSNYF